MYLASIEAQGYEATEDELEAYAQKPDRGEGRYGSFMSEYMSSFRSLRGWVDQELEPPESMTTYLLRLRWVQRHGGRLRLTRLGQAMARALEQETVTGDAVLTVVLQPDDPIALARVVERFARAGDALLVEPYFRLEHLLLVTNSTEITRVLTSERTNQADRSALKTGVEALTLARRFEVRVTGRELHDRGLIPPAGNATLIGSSLNSVGRVVTVMTEVDDGADQLRSVYERMWDEATHLASASQPSSPPPPASGQQSAQPSAKAAPRKKATAKKSAPRKKATAKKSARRGSNRGR